MTANPSIIAQIEEYGVYWEFTAYQNGIGVRLRKQGKWIGHSLFYTTWQHALTDIQPAPFVRVFVVASDSVFLPR